MNAEWLPRILSLSLLLPVTGCGTKGLGQAAKGSTPPYLSAPILSARPQELPRTAPAVPTATPTPPSLSAEDLAYLRWLIQFDAALQQIVAQQAHDLPSALEDRERTRTRALLKSWEDSRAEVAAANSHASTGVAFAERLRPFPQQFQSQPPPPNCQMALLLQNPRAASQMVPPDMQDGGVAEDSRLRRELQSARDSTNAALSDLTRRFPHGLPADIAAFRVR
ncbi:MAG: hypothetical protein V4671_25735 [Armatimonadota bacterium]